MSKKTFMAAIVICAVLISVAAVMLVYAQTTIPTPSVPEFTLKVVANPYDIAPTTTTDPFTGENVTTKAGVQVENRSIEVTIKNPPFSSYSDISGNNIRLYYNVTVKGHYENAWNYYFNNSYRGLLNASNSDYTIISIPFGSSPTVPLGGYPLDNVGSGDQVDFRVQAQIGYYNRTYTGMFAPVPGGDFYYVFTGETSGWSNTQTITIPDISSPSPNSTQSLPSTPTLPTNSSPTQTPTQSQSPAPNSTPTPSIPEFQPWIALTFSVTATILTFVIIRRRKAAC